jgi:hypothetical protein
LPERQRLQLSFGGNSTTLVRRPYFRRGIRRCYGEKILRFGI